MVSESSSVTKTHLRRRMLYELEVEDIRLLYRLGCSLLDFGYSDSARDLFSMMSELHPEIEEFRDGLDRADRRHKRSARAKARRVLD